ncbi:MAG: hypothetical protein ABJB04_01350 [Betaproteobacteria bacterium]
MPTSRSPLLITLVLLLLGALRIAWMVSHQPLLGYANQYDAGRTSACVGLWPNLPEPDRYEAHLEAPIAQYVEGQPRPAECYASSELVFVALAMTEWKVANLTGLVKSATMDLRYVGATKAIALLLLAIAFTIALRERPLWMIAHAAVFGLVLADPLVTLWMNTLYTEFAAVLFGYAAVCCLVVIAGVAPDRTRWYVALAAALIGLGLSRQQHAALPLFLSVLLLPAVWRYHRSFGFALLGVSALVIVLQAVVLERPPTIRAANNVNVVMGVVLPAALDPERALAALGLPERCAGSIGATWYVRMGESINERCPEVLTWPRYRLANVLLAEPAIAWRVMARAAPLAQTAVLKYLGVEQGQRYGTLQQQNSPLAFSIATPLEQLPLAVHLGWQFFLFVALGLAIATWMISGARWGAPVGPLVVAALAGTACYASVTSAFGDGIVELARHVQLGTTASYALAVIIVTTSALGAIAKSSPRIIAAAVVGAPTPVGFRLSLLIALLLIGMTGLLWFPAYRQQSLAVGAVDEPASNVITAPIVKLRGWAMDPFGPATAVVVVNDATKLETRPGEHPEDPSGAVLARVFPRYETPSAARFEALLDISRFKGTAIEVRTYAKNREGVQTEIDRRVLTRPGRPPTP